MSKMSRDKGKVGEREVANFLKEHGYTGAKRGVQYKGGAGSPDVTGLPGVHIEVKRVEAFRLWDALDQSTAEAAAGEVPVVFHRKNNRPWVVVLDAERFMTMYRLSERSMQMMDRAVNPPVIVKDQPEGSDWEKLKAENRRLHALLDEQAEGSDWEKLKVENRRLQALLDEQAERYDSMPDFTGVDWNG